MDDGGLKRKKEQNKKRWTDEHTRKDSGIVKEVSTEVTQQERTVGRKHRKTKRGERAEIKGGEVVVDKHKESDNERHRKHTELQGTR